MDNVNTSFSLNDLVCHWCCFQWWFISLGYDICKT